MPDITFDQQIDAVSHAMRETSDITEYLKLELDRAVAAKSSDPERLRFLAIEQGNWALRMRRFWRCGEQPFGGPHPEYGAMVAGDFLIVLGLIESARAVIKSRMADAEVLQ